MSGIPGRGGIPVSIAWAPSILLCPFAKKFEKKDKLEKFRKLIVAEMENALKPKFNLSVPLSVDSNNADNWSDAH